MRQTRIALFSGCLLLLQSTQATSPPAQPSASTAQQAAAVRRVQPLSERVANARGSPERQVTPSELRVQRKGSVLSVRWPSLPHAVPLSAELLRVNAPSPDVTDSKTVMYGKRGVAITGVTPVGSYAVRLQFSDGHDAGIYSYSYLQYLCEHRWSTMKKYIQQLRTQKKIPQSTSTKKI